MSKTAHKQSIPKVARFDLSIGINAETWRLLKSQSMSDDELAQHLKSDVESAVSKYEGYHSLIDSRSGVVDITLTKYY